MADVPESDEETKRRLRAHREEIDREQSPTPARAFVQKVKRAVLSTRR